MQLLDLVAGSSCSALAAQPLPHQAEGPPGWLTAQHQTYGLADDAPRGEIYRWWLAARHQEYLDSGDEHYLGWFNTLPHFGNELPPPTSLPPPWWLISPSY